MESVGLLTNRIPDLGMSSPGWVGTRWTVVHKCFRLGSALARQLREFVLPVFLRKLVPLKQGLFTCSPEGLWTPRSYYTKSPVNVHLIFPLWGLVFITIERGWWTQIVETHVSKDWRLLRCCGTIQRAVDQEFRALGSNPGSADGLAGFPWVGVFAAVSQVLECWPLVMVFGKMEKWLISAVSVINQRSWIVKFEAYVRGDKPTYNGDSWFCTELALFLSVFWEFYILRIK